MTFGAKHTFSRSRNPIKAFSNLRQTGLTDLYAWLRD